MDNQQTDESSGEVEEPLEEEHEEIGEENDAQDEEEKLETIVVKNNNDIDKILSRCNIVLDVEVDLITLDF